MHQQQDKQMAALNKEEYLNESIEIATDYFSKAGLNEEGLDLVIEEVGVEDFIEFVTELGVELNEERAARKMNVRTKGSIKKQIEKDAAAEAKRKEKKTGEYKEAPKKKAKVGGPSYATKVKPEAKKPEPKPVAKKVEKAVEKAKTKQPPKPISKGGLRDRISSAVKKGVERHKAAVKKVSSSPAAKGAKEFGKGVVSGVKDTVTFAKKAKKAVVGEEVLTEVKISRISPSDSKEDKKKKIQQMLDRQREWEKKQGKVPAGHATEEVVHEGKCDGCTCPGCSPDGVGHQNPCIECGGHHKEEKKVSEQIILEKDLSAKERRALPNKDFALPGKGEGPQGKQAGSYPIPDEKHARSALSLVSQHGTPEEKAKVRAKVKKKFPGIQVNEADDKAFKNVVGMLQKKYGKDSVLTKDSPKPKPQPKAKAKPQKPLSAKEKAQREVDARYGRTPWNKKGSLGT